MFVNFGMSCSERKMINEWCSFVAEGRVAEEGIEGLEESVGEEGGMGEGRREEADRHSEQGGDEGTCSGHSLR